MTMTPCRHCRTPKPSWVYVCPDCWYLLSSAARTALKRSDSHTFARLRELHEQIDADVPLTDIHISP